MFVIKSEVFIFLLTKYLCKNHYYIIFQDHHHRRTAQDQYLDVVLNRDYFNLHQITGKLMKIIVQKKNLKFYIAAEIIVHIMCYIYLEAVRRIIILKQKLI